MGRPPLRAAATSRTRRSACLRPYLCACLVLAWAAFAVALPASTAEEACLAGVEEVCGAEAEDSAEGLHEVSLLQRRPAKEANGKPRAGSATVAALVGSTSHEAPAAAQAAALREKRAVLLVELEDIKHKLARNEADTLSYTAPRRGVAAKASRWQRYAAANASDSRDKQSPGARVRAAGIGIECLWSFTPLLLHLQLDIMRAVAGFPERAPCTPSEIQAATVAVLPKHAASMLGASSGVKKHPKNTPDDGVPTAEWVVIGVYAIVYAIAMVVLHFVTAREAPGPQKEDPTLTTPSQSSGSRWLGCLRSLWPLAPSPERGGGAAALRVGGCQRQMRDAAEEKLDSARGVAEAEEGAAAVRDEQALSSSEANGRLMEELWLDEVRVRGEGAASLFAVARRCWTCRSAACLLFLVACRSMFVQVYSALLIEHSLNYFFWLREQRRAGIATDLTSPLLLAIVAFSALPGASGLLGALICSLNQRLDQRFCGGLSAALLRKAQRLPVDTLAAGGHPRSEKPHCEMARSSAGPAVAGAQRSPTSLGAFEVMQLVHDVNGALQGVCLHLCRCASALAAIVVLIGLLWVWLRLASLAVICCVLPAVVVAAFAGLGVLRAVLGLRTASDRRIAALRETVVGIRDVKSCGLEESVELRLRALRGNELSHLVDFHRNLGFILGALLAFPRVLVFACLWGFVALRGKYTGEYDVATVFVCMQLLTSLNCACDVFARSLFRVLQMPSSARRIEAFLRLPERSVAEPMEPGEPSTASSDECASGPLFASPAGQNVAPNLVPEIRLRGSFKWRLAPPYSGPALQSLRLDVARGELVAVIGRVGSGKSALLRAALNELDPIAACDADSTKPLVGKPLGPIAFCPQVPHIFSGSVRDNILFGQAYDAERYHAVVQALALEAELRRLPGGDGALVGARGVDLSASQRARLALARAAYHSAAHVVLLDDPLGALGGGPAAAGMLVGLLRGPLMSSRTCLVAVQRPDAALLRNFDRVLLLEGGRVCEQGPPAEVLRSLAFQRLAASGPALGGDLCGGAAEDGAGPGACIEETFEQRRSSDGDGAASAALRAQTPSERGAPLQMLLARLLEEGRETTFSWRAAKRLLQLGRLRNAGSCAFLFLAHVFAYFFCDLVLASWTNAIATGAMDADADHRYLRAYLRWLLFGFAVWVLYWHFGMRFTVRVSEGLHRTALHQVLRAPLGRFFDSQPASRIVDCFATDLATVDFYLLARITGLLAVAYRTLIPLLYMHAVLPLLVTVLVSPLYRLLWRSCARYWVAAASLRSRVARARAEVSNCVDDALNGGVTARAYGCCDLVASNMCRALDVQIAAEVFSERTLHQWLVLRVTFLCGLFTTIIYIVGLTNPSQIGAGTCGLCLTCMLLFGSLTEASLESVMGAHGELAPVSRLHAYATSLAQESARWRPGDGQYRNYFVRLVRADLGELSMRVRDDGSVEVLRGGLPLLHQASDGGALVAAATAAVAFDAAGHSSLGEGGLPLGEATLRALCPSHEALQQVHAWHRLAAANDADGDARRIAEELCTGTSEELVLEIRSGWLADGAEVRINSLVAGYAEASRGLLRGASLVVEPRSWVSLFGPSGGGNATLLLVLFGAPSPQSGTVHLGGVAPKDLGLVALREAVGLVPQQPLLFSGTLRQNLDPHNRYTDGRLWKALRAMHLDALVESWPSGLDHNVSEDGGYLSTGQRQLVCIARMVLRQPPLLLLDGAAAALAAFQAPPWALLRDAFPRSTVFAATTAAVGGSGVGLRATGGCFDRVVRVERGLLVE